MPLGEDASLTLSAEIRVREDGYGQGQLKRGNSYGQGQLRTVAGADLRLGAHVRLFGEVASGHVAGRRDSAAPSFQNVASAQQLFAEFKGSLGTTQAGVLVGRQEFADGPKQLISLGDGPNLHRTWNGVRAYLQGTNARAGVFDFRATGLAGGSFDERVNHGERLQGAVASLILSCGPEVTAFVDPFWYHSVQPVFRLGSRVGQDIRDTAGTRLWGQWERLKFDITLAHQSGRFQHQEVDAWGLFTVHSYALSREGWKPTLTLHVDAASGGGFDGSGRLTTFNPLYASSSYLGEGQFLGLGNLLLVAPGLSVAPTPTTRWSAEYGLARRMTRHDPAYAGGLRAYAGTAASPERRSGGLLRITGSWTPCELLTFSLNYEHLSAEGSLHRAGLPSGSYGYLGATYRY
ncbi:MAG TPA: alginate export family protein [Geothrix sp.]|nr:alginate export family protein [Geothrix sp.]